RFQGPDCCLRLPPPGSARSAPYGINFRRGRVHSRYGLQLRFSSLRRPALTGRRRLTSGLLWRLARAGLPPAGRSALLGNTEVHKFVCRLGRAGGTPETWLVPASVRLEPVSLSLALNPSAGLGGGLPSAGGRNTRYPRDWRWDAVPASVEGGARSCRAQICRPAANYASRM